MVKVWIDAGHGGKDPGAVANGLFEEKMNLVTALEVQRLLKLHGITVGMTRTTDVYSTLSERAVMANKWGADLFVSLHYNAGGGHGYEVIHGARSSEGKALATAIAKELKDQLKQTPHGTGTYSRTTSGGIDYYGVIRETKMPAVIVEPGYLDSSDHEEFDSVAEQKAAAKAVVDALLKHLKMYKATPAPAKAPAKAAPAKKAPVKSAPLKTHKVVSGDSLSKIAVKYKTTVARLKSTNKLLTDTIKVGQVLKIPALVKFTLHTVKSGDTLSEIAAKNGTTVAKIKVLSKLKSDVIKPGLVLRVK